MSLTKEKPNKKVWRSMLKRKPGSESLPGNPTFSPNNIHGNEHRLPPEDSRPVPNGPGTISSLESARLELSLKTLENNGDRGSALGHSIVPRKEAPTGPRTQLASTDFVAQNTEMNSEDGQPLREVEDEAFDACINGEMPLDVPTPNHFQESHEIQRLKRLLSQSEEEKQMAVRTRDSHWKELEETREQLRNANRTNGDLLSKVQSKDAQLVEKQHRVENIQANTNTTRRLHQQELLEKEGALIKVKSKFEALQKEQKETLETVQQALDAKNQAQDDKENMLEKWREATSALNKLQEEMNYKADDTYFSGIWRTLQANIENLTLSHFGGRPAKPSKLARAKASLHAKPEDEPAKDLIFLTSEWSKYLGSERGRPLLMQAFIWNMLNYCIFDSLNRHSQGLYWAGNLRTPLSRLRADLRSGMCMGTIGCYSRVLNLPFTEVLLMRGVDETAQGLLEKEIRDYHKWRAITTQLLLSKRPKRILPHEIAELVDDVVKYLRRHFTNPTPENEANFKNRLADIFTEAIHLDGEMNQQRAFLFCEMWVNDYDAKEPWGFPFDSSMMQAIEDPGKGSNSFAVKATVELLISPALFKAGNAYGENYHVRSPLVKAKVVVSEHPALKGSK
jgi:hypothetical protein